MNLTPLGQAISEKDQHVMGALITAWNLFAKLPADHPDDVEDFRRAIHECQRIMAYRFARRAAPGLFGHKDAAKVLEDVKRNLNQHQMPPSPPEGFGPWWPTNLAPEGVEIRNALGWYFGTEEVVPVKFDGYLWTDLYTGNNGAPIMMYCLWAADNHGQIPGEWNPFIKGMNEPHPVMDENDIREEDCFIIQTKDGITYHQDMYRVYGGSTFKSKDNPNTQVGYSRVKGWRRTYDVATSMINKGH